MTSFLLESNVQMIWNVLMNSEIIKSNIQKINFDKIEEFFKKYIFEFYEREKNYDADLLSLNKKFITNIITVLNTNINSQTNKPNQPSQPNNNFTREYYVENRMNETEKEFKNKQNDFLNYVSKPVPEKPSFLDTQKENTIQKEELNLLMKKTLEEREQYEKKIDFIIDNKQINNQQPTIQQNNQQNNQQPTIQQKKYIKIFSDELKEFPMEIQDLDNRISLKILDIKGDVNGGANGDANDDVNCGANCDPEDNPECDIDFKESINNRFSDINEQLSIIKEGIDYIIKNLKDLKTENTKSENTKNENTYSKKLN